MPKAILISGISGSGKTTYARSLEASGYTRISLDEIIWERFGASFPTLTASEQQAATALAEDELEHRMSLALKQGSDVALDWCLCKRAKRERMRHAAMEAGAEVKLVFMECPLDELKKRLAARSSIGPDTLPVAPDMVERFFHGFERPDEDENAMVINTAPEKKKKL